MRKLRALWMRLTKFRGARAEFDAELQSHIELHVADAIRQGMDPEEARRLALIRLGGAEQVRQLYRERAGLPSLESILRDIRYALRQLIKSPAFAFTAILTLALGIGANTAVFSLFDNVLLHPLPYSEPDRLMLITESEPSQGSDEYGVAIQEARDYQRYNHSFEQMGIFEGEGFNLTGMGRPLRVNAAAISPSAFSLLGTSPMLGRTFAEGEDQSGRGHVVVLSAALWRNQFASDPNILGKSLRLDETAYTIIGVMPPSFRFPYDGSPRTEMAELWVPDVIASSRLDPDNRLMEFGVGLVGRLKPGIRPEQAAAEIATIAANFQAAHPDVYSPQLRVLPHTYALTSYSMRKGRQVVILLSLAVACVLLIACANVANLLLARATKRSQEMAIRSAIGANRTRLIRQCVIESLVLASAGAALGFALAEALLASLRAWGPESVPRLHDAAIRPLVVVFTIGLTWLTGMIFGIVPAWKMSRIAPVASTKAGARSNTSRSSHRLQNSIVITEVALALVLLVSGGLLIRSLMRVLDIPIGFDARQTTVVRTMFDEARYPDPARRRVVQARLIDDLSRLPGVTSVAAASHLPLSDERLIGIRMEHAASGDFHFAANSVISPGYFRAMGIPLLEGRDFDRSDLPSSIPVAVVSRAFAITYFGQQDPIGKRFYWGDRGLFTVVGVAGDVHIASLDADPPPMVYLSMFQAQTGVSARTAFVLRSAQNAVDLQAVRTTVARVDPELPLYDISSLSELIDQSLAQRRFILALLCGFGAAAALLATIGLFGVLSYIVEQRQREIGLRMALGARRSDVMAMVLKKAATLVGAGLAGGLVFTWMALRTLRAFLFGVSAHDPLTILLVSVILLLCGLLAALVPSHRAAWIDPMKSLRTE